MSANLTLDALLEMKSRISTILYYATSDTVEKGSVMIVKFDSQLKDPNYFMCHPADLERIKESNFVQLSKAPIQFSQPPMRYKTRWVP